MTRLKGGEIMKNILFLFNFQFTLYKCAHKVNALRLDQTPFLEAALKTPHKPLKEHTRPVADILVNWAAGRAGPYIISPD